MCDLHFCVTDIVGLQSESRKFCAHGNDREWSFGLLDCGETGSDLAVICIYLYITASHILSKSFFFVCDMKLTMNINTIAGTIVECTNDRLN